MAVPTAGARGLSAQDDPYARPERADTGYAEQAPAQEPPRLAEPDTGPGASYDQPSQGYAAQPAPSYNRRADTYQTPQTVAADDPTNGMTGPRGTSDGREVRYDEVGYAGVRGVAGGEANGGAVVAVAKSVPAGTFLEVTALDTGRTVLVFVTGSLDPAADHPLDLSRAAARQLGASGDTIAVRVRKVAASPSDQAALRAGQPAAERADTPPVLLTALRKHLPAGVPAQQQAYSPAPRRPTATAIRPAPAPGRGGYYVQVGAFSNAANAQSLAQTLGGFVRPGGGLNRVQMGPYRSSAEAEAARANAARHGYGDARIFTQ